MFDIEKLKHEKGIDQRTIAICEKINANEEKRNSCNLHDFEITGVATKYRCKNCGCEEDGGFIKGYKQGVEHGKKASNSEIKQLKRERDAAVKDLSGIAEAVEACEICTHNHTSEYNCEISDDTCVDCKNEDCFCKTCDHGDEWEWRGCAENGGK